ncbi:hypothetical protein KP509_06G056600 [Ceratopteris richardii]|uniref:C2H2-type domain-containing protein n=1 Tax=Ceratopteris richardii TaxID=49495 RepID=A0A8T2UPF9_CERRI|nr:hypothetical protein KP509_06G056600 [Ceratopteris richardii]
MRVFLYARLRLFVEEIDTRKRFDCLSVNQWTKQLMRSSAYAHVGSFLHMCLCRCARIFRYVGFLCRHVQASLHSQPHKYMPNNSSLDEFLFLILFYCVK